MKVIINKKEIEVDSSISTLAQLLHREGLDLPGRAVAVDNRIAPRGNWDTTPIYDGMKITVIQAVCGG